MSDLGDIELGEATAPAASEPMLVDPRPARETTPRRRPGRPRKDAQPIEATLAADTSKPARKTPTKTIEVSKAETARQLEGLHHLLAMATDIPDFAITSQEAMMIASPFVDICVSYGIPLDGKGAPIISLIAAMGLVYGPKIPRIKARLDEKRAAFEAAQRQAQQPVVDVSPAPNGAAPIWRPGMTVDANL